MRRPVPLPASRRTAAGSPGPVHEEARGDAAPAPVRAVRAGDAPVGAVSASAVSVGGVPVDAVSVDTASVDAASVGAVPMSGADGAAGADDAARSAPVGRWALWRAVRARRRALRAEMRRFTAKQRRRRAIWIGVFASLAGLVAGSVGAAYSPLFAVRTIEVVGTQTLEPAEVAAALHSQVGTPLPLVSAETVKAALVGFPLVESYSLEARPPHVLVVRVVERTPVGVVKGPAGYTVVDAAGVALRTTSKRPDAQPVLTVTGGVHSEAFRAVGQVIRSLPRSLAAQVTAASATTPDDVTLTLGETGTKVVWGSADDSAMKALVLAKTVKARPAKDVSVYDVSSAPSAVMVR